MLDYSLDVYKRQTTHVVNYKNCIIVIKNVPCLECDQCGEKYYTDEVAERLEMIVDMAKKLIDVYKRQEKYFHKRSFDFHLSFKMFSIKSRY